jgi:hypothetical protein
VASHYIFDFLLELVTVSMQTAETVEALLEL